MEDRLWLQATAGYSTIPGIASPFRGVLISLLMVDLTALIGNKRVWRGHSARIPSAHGCAPNCGLGHVGVAVWIGGVPAKEKSSPNDAETRVDRLARLQLLGCTVHNSGTPSDSPYPAFLLMLGQFAKTREALTHGGGEFSVVQAFDARQLDRQA